MIRRFSLVTFCVACAWTLGCGGDKPKAMTPEPMTSSSSAPTGSAAPAASTAPSAAPSASTAPAEAAKPTMKGAFHAFNRAASSGKVDKIGEKDGAFKPDGVKDTTFDVDYEGPAKAFFVMTTDAQGELTSEFDADTLVGDQAIPKELAPIYNKGKITAGLAVYDGDKLLNAKDGGLTQPLADGPHKLTLALSHKAYPKSAVIVYALLPDDTLVKGPVLAKP